MNAIVTILWAIWVIVLLVLYHKVFQVYYFSIIDGFVKELIVAMVLGVIMVGLMITFWWLIAIIVILVGVANMGLTGKKEHLILAAIFAIIITILRFSII